MVFGSVLTAVELEFSRKSSLSMSIRCIRCVSQYIRFATPLQFIKNGSAAM